MSGPAMRTFLNVADAWSLTISPMLVGCVVWMSIGIFVMKRMINFDF